MNKDMTQHEPADTGTRHSKDQAGALTPQHKAASTKGQSGLEAALQCEEYLADDVAAPPGTGQAYYALYALSLQLLMSTYHALPCA